MSSSGLFRDAPLALTEFVRLVIVGVRDYTAARLAHSEAIRAASRFTQCSSSRTGLSYYVAQRCGSRAYIWWRWSAAWPLRARSGETG